MHDFEALKHTIGSELEEFNRRGNLSSGDLGTLHMLSDIYKNLCKISMLEEGQSYDGGGSYGGGSYGGYSGRHYVRGHYSRDSSNDGYSRDGSYRGYSRDEAKDYIVQQVEEMMGRVHDQRDRETLKRIMQQMQNG